MNLCGGRGWSRWEQPAVAGTKRAGAGVWGVIGEFRVTDMASFAHTHGASHTRADDADVLPQPRGVEGAELSAVERDSALERVVEALQQGAHRRLAGT